MIDVIRNQLRAVTSVRRDLGGNPVAFLGPEHLVECCGVEFTAIAPITLGAPKQCYDNAYRLFSRSLGVLHYCEGFACAEIEFAVQHAWCCDDDGVIYDPTWSVEDDWRDHYLGCVIDDDYVRSEALRKKMPGVLLDSIGRIEDDVLKGLIKLRKTAW